MFSTSFISYFLYFDHLESKKEENVQEVDRRQGPASSRSVVYGTWLERNESMEEHREQPETHLLKEP